MHTYSSPPTFLRFSPVQRAWFPTIHQTTFSATLPAGSTPSTARRTMDPVSAMNIVRTPVKTRVRAAVTVAQKESALPRLGTHNFTEVYELYKDAVYRYCFWKCRDRDVGLDLMQETFLRFCLCLQRKEKVLHARAFLYRIAHNLFVDHVRRKKEASLDQLLEDGFEPSVDLWHQTYSQLDAERPLKTLGTMQDSHRQVLHRRFILGLTPKQIGTMTGETANTVSVRIFRGLRDLRLQLRGCA